MEAVLGKQGILELRSLHVGGLFHDEEEIQMTNSVPNFVGSMQQFIITRYIILNWHDQCTELLIIQVL